MTLRALDATNFGAIIIEFYYNFQIQADNCWSENKNHYVLGFLAKLVQDEVFETVELHFLYRCFIFKNKELHEIALSLYYIRPQEDN